MKDILKLILSILPLKFRVYLLCKRNIWFKNFVLKQWKLKGCPAPAPHAYKQNLISAFKEKSGYTTLVETGTYCGAMVDAQKNNFERIVSVELSNDLYNVVKKRFQKYKNIELYQGDSGKILRKIFLDKPSIFFLDSHYSGGITAKGDKECPIYEEIDAIFKTSYLNHILVIDDARCFTGTEDYPSIEELIDYVKSKDARYNVEVKHDVIEIKIK